MLHQPSLDRLTEFFNKIGREMTKNNEKQAWLPEGCTVFTNLWGTAPGCAFEAYGKHVLMLPGPPRECNPMWKECAMPYLYKLRAAASFRTTSAYSVWARAAWSTSCTT